MTMEIQYPFFEHALRSYIPININYISDYESIDIHAYLHKMRVLDAPRYVWMYIYVWFKLNLQ